MVYQTTIYDKKDKPLESYTQQFKNEADLINSILLEYLQYTTTYPITEEQKKKLKKLYKHGQYADWYIELGELLKNIIVEEI